MTTVEQHDFRDGDAVGTGLRAESDGGNAPLGVAGGILLSLPLWALIIGAVWLLLR